MNQSLCLISVCITLSAGAPVHADERALLGHWRLAGDTNDASGHGHHAIGHGVDLAAPGPDGKPNGAARFDGRQAFLEIPTSKQLSLGREDFTVALWARTDEPLDDVSGDLLNNYDPVARRGINWCIKSGAGTPTSRANNRNIHFGIDAGSEPKWADCGRPGNAVYVMALAVHNGGLYAGTCETGNNDAGHVYRWEGGRRWADCGRPDRCNAVTSLAACRGKLYAGTGRYRLAGSALPESANPNLGGKVFRYDGDGQWTLCGHFKQMEAVGGMVEFRGELYASSLYRPPGFFRYRDGRQWIPCPTPRDGRRVVALGVYNGSIYGTSYDACNVYRYDGQGWEDLGALETAGQTYSFEVYAGALFVGTWPNGRVFRSANGRQWINAGQLGAEKEVMGMAVFNGKLYAGTLPSAEVYRFDGGATWTSTGQLDRTPAVRYRRAWSMAVYQGQLFCGTLPSGRVYSLTAGYCVTDDHALPPGWRHLAARRQGGRLTLFVDGKSVAEAAADGAASIDLTNDRPWTIGFGAHDYFRGSLADVRVYKRALPTSEIAALVH